MKKSLLGIFLALVMLTGCAPRQTAGGPWQYTDYSLFDTVTTVIGYGGTAGDFEAQARELCGKLQTYHRLLDIYQEYDGMVNLKTVNEKAGQEPVEVDPILMAFLQDCKDYYALTDGKVNVAMGSVLKLWHDARTLALEHPDQAALPDPEALQAAAQHCGMEDVVLDPEAGTVFFADPELQLDVGAAAKGWSVQQVCAEAPEGLLISVGGNVFAPGPKPDGSPWIVGVQRPDGGEGYLATPPLTRGSAVTSGDYQRYFTLDGKNYHHIIDPETLAPGTYWRSVTVLCADSGLADCLSTALFLLPQAEGQALLDKTGAEAMWADAAGNLFYSPGFPRN